MGLPLIPSLRNIANPDHPRRCDVAGLTPTDNSIVEDDSPRSNVGSFVAAKLGKRHTATVSAG
jgi:hypothetical protein